MRRVQQAIADRGGLAISDVTISTKRRLMQQTAEKKS